jgi:uncharacterized phiE125 gp8 family phage protein
MKLITPPQPPCTLAEAKAQCRVTNSEEDELIEHYMAAAVSHIDGPEGLMRKAVMPQTWEKAFDAFPSSEIKLPLMPVISVDWVRYTDADGAEQTVSDSDYEVDTYSDFGWIVPTASWPSTMATINAVRVRWTAGATEVPVAFKQAVLLMVSHYFDHRGSDAETPPAVHHLIDRVKRVVFA